jgi:hypothetical protein
MIMRKTGANLMNMISGMNSAPQANTTAPPRKRRMRGPSIPLDDLPDVAEPEVNVEQGN